MKPTSIINTLLSVVFFLSPLNSDAYSNNSSTLSKTAKLIPYLNSEKQDEELFLLTLDLLNLIKDDENKTLIRNGDIGLALILLEEYQTFKEPISFKTKVCCISGGREAKKKLRAFKLQMIKVLETEAIITRQKTHFPALFEAVNDLKNSNGRALPIYIFSHEELPIFHEIGGALEALTIMAKIGENFTSDSPGLRKFLPNLKKANNAISIHIVFNEPGKTLSHEFGHVLYLYHNWESHQKFIKENGESHKFGGHLAGDPNGRAAELAERGIMPAVTNIK